MVNALQLGPRNLPILRLTVCSLNWCLCASFTHICGAHHFAHSKCKWSHTVTASLSLANSACWAILQVYSCHHDGRFPSVLYVKFACMRMCMLTWSSFCLTRHALYLNSEPAYMGSSSEIPSLYFLSEQGISEEPPCLLAFAWVLEIWT